MPIKLSICESDLHFKKLLLEHVHRTLSFDLIEDYSNGFELIKRLQNKQNNFLLIDAFTPIITGIEALKILRKKQNKTPIIIYTQVYQEDLASLFDAYDHVYYCQKDSAMLFKNLLALQQKNTELYSQYLQQWKTETQEYQYLENSSSSSSSSRTAAYTPSSLELKIINHICKGLTNKEIGKEVHLSGRTIETYIKKLTEKFRVKNKVQLITYCVEQHLHHYK